MKKENSKKSEWKQYIKIGIAMVLVSAVSIGGTMAFLSTKSEEKKNVFLGSRGIGLTINESFDEDEAKSYTPGKEIAKVPTLTNSTESNYHEWVAMKVSYLKSTDGGGNYSSAEYTDLTSNVIEEIVFKEDTAVSDTDDTNNWVRIADGTGYSIFVYKTALGKDGTTDSLFEKVQIKNSVKGWDGTDITDDDINAGTKTFPAFRIDVVGAAIKDENNGDLSLDFLAKYDTASTTEKAICDELISLLTTP